ncbi:MAG TPA: GlsB/YeaQ/YmgE family stress response membrane protein [Anaerolineae bacterium]|nr:GlsB/YeaQ/YmgE family stress response membrane protein [Anaerolineae bacterium]MCB9108587.1 GlsB/YeaQ/YmgE family stress response membrane protein [Anaerolineales bacterium]HRV94879.1 GlsB/YeaQ/YmgE family stress response membrane protein [Anaerolineae bacterium]
MIYSIISWLVVGFIIGALAKFVMPGRDPGGCLVTSLIGIAGAFVGGFLSSLLGFGGFTGFNFISIIFGIVGAVILLLLYRLAVKR